jgi:adenosylhomocysteine nucleosidase
MIAITFALATESLDLRRRLRELRQDVDFTTGKIGDRAITILHTGVGTKNCAERMETLLHKARPRIVVSSGFAGAIDPSLKVGDLIIAGNFSDRRSGETAEKVLAERSARTVNLFTSASIIDSGVERAEVARSSNAAAVDMETATIVKVCHAHGAPVLSLRAISDSPEQPFPAPPNVLFDIELQRTNYSRLLAYLLKHPGSISQLARFGREINRVRAKLTDAIVALVRAL